MSAHEKVDEAARFMQQAVSDLTMTLEKAGGEAGLISGEICPLVNGCGANTEHMLAGYDFLTCVIQMYFYVVMCQY